MSLFWDRSYFPEKKLPCGELHEVMVQVADPPRDGDELRQEPSGLLAGRAGLGHWAGPQRDLKKRWMPTGWGILVELVGLCFCFE